MTDARFRDGEDAPLRLGAQGAEDLQVISALLQDAVLPSNEISWKPGRQVLAMLVNRFRWEDRAAAERAGRSFERVQSVLTIGSALRVASNGVDPRDKDLVLSILALEFTPGEDGTGRITLMLAGDGELAVEVECIDVSLVDVSRPSAAPSGTAPTHKLWAGPGRAAVPAQDPAARPHDLPVADP